MNTLKIALVIAFILICSSTAFGRQNGSPLEITKITSEITLDGLSSENAWNNVNPLPLTMFQPVYQGEPTDKSEILVAYDEDFLYLAGRFYLSDPTNVSINTFKRDGFSNSDCFNIVIDSYNDNENALYFMTTPSGLRRDCLLSKDGEGWNLSWNTFWDTESVINEEGWFTEVRIPFSSLRFQDDNGDVTMGLLVHRYTIKLMERVTFPPVSPSITNEPFKPSMAYDIKLKGIYSKKPVYITPYILSGLDRSFILNSSGDGYSGIDNKELEGGLDLKYNITSNLTLDLTANTDFAQVEADNQQVNLTRFSLFFPEKRQFFQERSNIFEFGTGGGSRLFHSRRIGLKDNGEAVRVFGGARIVGRIGEWDMGFLNMHTDDSEETPSENFGVLRLRRRVINPYSYIGGMVTNRLGNDGSYNTAIGLDGTIRVKGDEYLTYNLATAFEKNRTSNFIDQSRIRAGYERKKYRGLFYSTEIMSSGSDYNPGMGFIFREDVISTNQTIGYGITPSAESKLRNIRYSLNFNNVYSKRMSELETFNTSGNLYVEKKAGMILMLGGEYSRENIFNEFHLETGENVVSVPAGEYDFGSVNLTWAFGEGQKISPMINTKFGKFYDGNIRSAGTHIGWFFSKFINVSTNYSFNNIQFDNRDQTYKSHLAGMRTELTLNTKFSLNSFLQYNSISDKFVSNIRFRYNFSEGTDLYIVYNDRTNTNRDIHNPRLPYADNRAVIMKLTKTFVK